MENPLRIRLHVLSPIHIGCDDIFEPTSFVIDENRNKLVEFDPADFIKHLTAEQRNEFMRICSGDNLLAIYKFVKRVFNQEISGRKVDIASGLLEHYKSVLKKSSYDTKAIINQFTINKTAYNPQTNEPYIPGTSVKGAARTAYLSHLAVSKGKKDAKEKAKDLEIALLQGEFDTDPFRMVKVSDFQSVEQVRTKIVYGVNKKKRVSDWATKASSGPLQIFEVIESGGVFEGIINIGIPEKKAGIKTPVEQTTLLKAVHQHYNKLYAQEVAITKECGFRPVTADSFSKRFGDSCFLIRIGRHSGAEAVTIEGNRNIKIMQGYREPPKYSRYGSTTIWLASETARPTANNGLTPFGWAVLEIVPFDAGKGLFATVRKEFKSPSPSETINESSSSVQDGTVDSLPGIIKNPPEQITWRNVTLVWRPNDQTLSTVFEGKKAERKIGTDRSFVPGHYHKKLFKGKKHIQADIVVEHIGGNAFRIIAFNEE